MSFGTSLRKRRLQTDLEGRPLTQQKLADEIERRTDLRYTSAAISDWERGRTNIHKDDRALLVGIVGILHTYGGLSTDVEANDLLAQGNYRALNTEELAQLDLPKSEILQASTETVVEPSAELTNPWLTWWRNRHDTEAFDGAVRDETDHITSILNSVSDASSYSRFLKIVLWIFVAGLVRWLILPVLTWPVIERMVFYQYGMAVIIVPLLIGALSLVQKDKRWQGRQIPFTQRFFWFYSGAVIGFQVGFGIAFAIALYVQWFELGDNWLGDTLKMIASIIILISAHVGAVQVASSLWKIKGETFSLDWSDSWVWFVFAVITPALFLYISRFEWLWMNAKLGFFTLLVAFGLVGLIGVIKDRDNGSKKEHA